MKLEPRLAAPAQFSKATRELWKAIVTSWSLSEEGLALLRVACEARERMLAADGLLKKQGLVITTRRGAVRANPAARVRRDAESTFLQALRQLGLEE